MKNSKKLYKMRGYVRIAWAILLILILSVVVLAQTTNFTNISVSGWLNSTSPVRMDGTNIIKTMTFYIDSLGQDQTVAVFTLERGITVLRADVWCQSATATDTCEAIFRNGTTAVTVKVPTSATAGSYTTDVSFAAATVCSVFTVDQSSGTGGSRTNFILQYTDY